MTQEDLNQIRAVVREEARAVVREETRAVVREEIANTVANPGEVDEEMHHLFAVLAR